MPNRVDLVVHYLACFKAELIATPLNYRYTATEIDHALRVSGARVLLAHEERAADVAASELASGLELGTIAYRDAEPLPHGGGEPDADARWTGDFSGLLESEPLPRVSGDPTRPRRRSSSAPRTSSSPAPRCPTWGASSGRWRRSRRRSRR